MIRTKTAEEIEILRENALLVSKTLAEVATTAAINHLEREGGDSGFVLMVEGSIIDGAGHGNDAEGQLKETY